MDIKKAWEFIEEQFERCRKRMESRSYKDAIDLIYDIAGNISNLHIFMEQGNISTDKGKILNNLSIMFRNGVFSEDFGLVLREKWELRNIAKYGYFASRKIDIKSVEIPENEVITLFKLIENMVSEFKKYLEGKHAK